MNQFDSQYTNMIVKPMCSDICPCDGDMFAAWAKTGVDVKKHSRTFKATATERSRQNSKGITANVVELVGAKAGAPAYKTFMECYEKVLKTQKPVTSGRKANGG